MKNLALPPVCRQAAAKIAFLLCASLAVGFTAVQADTAAVASKANTLITNASTVRTSDYTLALDKQWTNLPGGTRNGPTIGGGALATSSDINTAARTAAIDLCTTALGATGYNTMNEIRLADDIIRSSTAGSGQSWNYSNYHIAALVPSTVTSANLASYLASSPWMLQISGHHLTYNITYNGQFVSATPVFLGTEPPDYYRLASTNAAYPNYAVVKGRINGTTSYYISNPDKTANGSSSNVTIATTDPGVSSATKHAPLDTQRSAVAALATAVQADATLKTSAKLASTFTDVVMGVTNNGDGNFPFIGTTPTYPTDTADTTTNRGVRFGSLTATQQATFKPLVKAAIEAWVKTQADDISASLLADYESDTALAQTYIGYQVGTGSADGSATRANFDADINNETTPVNSANSYLRVDGPRVWIEFVVQAAVAYNTQKWVHYHSLWRDRLTDYGNEFGGFLDKTTSTGTAALGSGNTTLYTRPSITTQPTSKTGSSATFTVVAAPGNTNGSTSAVAYQWYSSAVGSGTAISGATAASYTATSVGTYYVTVSTLYGTVTSSAVTLTASATASAPTITAQPASKTVALGSTASFSVSGSVTDGGTLSYQWYKGSVGSGAAISGATSPTYTTAAATSANNGDSYYVIVTSTLGGTTAATTSSAAILTVNAPPTISASPLSQSVTLGGSASFTVTAAGSGTLSYQWYKGSVGSGAAINGANSPTYTINPTTMTSGGSYYAVVTSDYGTATSAAVTLTSVEPFAAFLATYGLNSVDPATDSDGDGLSNLDEFILGGVPTTADTSILPTVSATTAADGTVSLAYSFYNFINLGSATWAVEYSTDLTTWTTAVAGTGGVTSSTAAFNASYNYTTVTIPNTGGSLFVRLRATLPSTYTGTVSNAARITAATKPTQKRTAVIGSQKQ